jgi:hypothetical protein
MTILRHTLRAFGLLAFILAATSAAQAQATRTWVSGVGDDVNPCSRTAPCKTFAGAISKTAMGGEIDALDSGGFGAVTITKSITIDGGTAGLASILASGTTGVIVNIGTANAADTKRKVTLRRLSINGAGTTLGTRGVNFIAGLGLSIEDCYIQNFSSEGIQMSHVATGAFLSVKDTSIDHCATGINLTTSTGFVVGFADRVRIEKMTGNGVTVGVRGHFSIKNSFVMFNGADGLSVAAAATDGTLNVESTMVNHNTTGIRGGPNGSFVRLSNATIQENGTGLATAGGAIQSHGNNSISGNTSPGTAPTVIGPQ